MSANSLYRLRGVSRATFVGPIPIRHSLDAYPLFGCFCNPFILDNVGSGFAGVGDARRKIVVFLLVYLNYYMYYRSVYIDAF